MIDTSILHYRITNRLGAGAMGEVYLARDERTERLVALKFVGRTQAAEGEARARLTREARAAARLNHPAIVTVHGLEDTGDQLFLVQEYVQGETLAARLARGPLPLADAERLARSLATALAHAHAHGVHHRDLKPDNVLVAADGQFKIADFGIARVDGAAALTVDGSILGTLPYMAPERLEGAAGDARADLFALGAILYEALTGLRAFPGATQAEVLYAVVRGEPAVPALPAAAQPLLAVALHLLAKDPAARPADGDAVCAMLDAWTRTGTAPLPHRPRRRVQWAAALGAACALVAALGLWGRGHVAAEAGTEPAVAVLPFVNVADPTDPERTGAVAGTLLVSSLAQTGQVNVLGSQSVVDAIEALPHRADGALTRDDAVRVAERTHAARLVRGSILQTAPQWVVSAEVVDVASGRVLHSARLAGTRGQSIFDVVDDLGTRLLEQMVPGFSAARATPYALRTGDNLSAYQHYVAGQEALARGEFESASADFAAALDRDSTLAAAAYQLGVTQWWGGEPDAAGASIEHARRFGDRLTGSERDMLDALAALVAGHWGDAEARLREIDRRWPGDKQVLYGLVEATYHGGHPERTLVAARRAARVAPEFLLPRVHLVDALAVTGHTDEAERLARETLARDPHFAFMWHSLFTTRLYHGDGAGALDVLRHARAAGVHDPLVYSEGGHLACALDSTDAARLCYVNPHAPAWKQTDARRGLAFKQAFARGDFVRAERIAEDAWAAFPRDVRVSGGAVPLANGANAAMALGDSVRAFAFIDSVYARHARSGRLHGADLDFDHLMDRAWVEASLGKTVQAQAHVRQLRRSPLSRRDFNPVQLRLIDADVALREGRGADALALLAGPPIYQDGFFRYNSVRLLRARAQMQLGDHARALATLDTLAAVPVLRLDDAALLHLDRAHCCEALGRRAEAVAAYERFLALWRDAPATRREVRDARAALARLRTVA